MTKPRESKGKVVALRVISLYQAARAGRPTSCRFQPSCSTYAAEAIEAHGLVRGSRMALGRLARCRPFGSHGIDPMPIAEGSR